MSPVKRAYDQFLRLESVRGDADDSFALSETGDSILFELSEDTAKLSSNQKLAQSKEATLQANQNMK